MRGSGPATRRRCDLKGFSLAISKHDGNPRGVSYVWLTEPHEQADEALDTLLEVVGIGEEAVAFRGDAHDVREERRTASQEAPPSLWARFRRAIGVVRS
ncbi:hypothetical protein [Streptomyces erythrochromogenes]|uniref:hypothetical protein n=1 Tax=Streptomyces erythrochromogenes TaxID=285574 RepID=UPI00386914B3|nr:hypothetical protein OG489_38235 [Streptomyces erythrochromogenes]